MTSSFVPYDAVVVGAGISGLTCAFALRHAGLKTMVLEAADRPGGCISSVRRDGCIVDGGPQTFSASPPFTRLVTALSLDARVQRAATGASSFLFAHGRLSRTPSSPGAFLSSTLLSPAAKLRLIAEPFIGAKIDGADETVAAFAARRGGHDVVDAIVRPIVGGIFAGDPAQLSMREAFPALVDLEQRYSSVLVGAIARGLGGRRPSGGQRAPRAPLDFAGGNDTLVGALAESLEPDVRTRAAATEIVLRGAHIEVVYDERGRAEGAQQSVVARHAVLATPAYETSRLLSALEPVAAEALAAIPHAPVAQVALSYARSDISVDLRGFGFLSGEDSRLRILGCAFNSAMFADRCPPDRALLTAFLGGVNDPGVAQLRDDEIVRIAHADLQTALEIEAAPAVVAGFRWERAIPQFTVGHANRLRAIADGVARLPQVSLTGNYFRGPSVSDCIAGGFATAEAVAARLRM